MPDLPPELWTQIFDLAADEGLILQHRLSTLMSGLEHFQKNLWISPAESLQEELDRVQRRSYRTKKAIVLTCKRWRALEHESLFRFLCFRAAPSRLCDILDTSAAAATTAAASLGWWTRRIHAEVMYDSIKPEEHPNALVRILRHCPNLEIFVVERMLQGTNLTAIADALLHKLVATLPALPYICVAHIDLYLRQHVIPPAGPDDRLRLPHLQQLSLSGSPHQLLHAAKHWHLPALRTVMLSCAAHPGAHHPAIPALLAFLAVHGAQLTELELSFGPVMPLGRMLAACPALTALVFNGDWAVDLLSDAGAPQGTPPFAHARLARVGLHGLMHAFSRDPELEGERVAADMNERALALLCDRVRFPALRRVRVLNGEVSRERERAQAEGGGTAQRSARTWARWDGMFARAEIQLENWSGKVLPPWPWSSTDRHDDEVKQAGD
ncbi:hypothetical protein B0H15DRAFT_1027143 [Mycena belliarum]|uniref:Uncharacterized protein n=1 Tax=Mycena belliarum TaxID=1033014 RepID=A0AAD6TP33_9AGAR|nr:hypothetical protein B0H15DRAFT_1027143 [Mycena belliae]